MGECRLYNKRHLVALSYFLTRVAKTRSEQEFAPWQEGVPFRDQVFVVAMALQEWGLAASRPGTIAFQSGGLRVRACSGPVKRDDRDPQSPK